MNILKDIPPGNENEINLIIEIPKGMQNKYEYDKEHKIFALDGFVILNEPTFPGILVKVRPIGVIEMVDNGEQDNKLLCVAVADPYHKNFKDVKDLSDHFLKSVKHFLEHYKDLQGKKVEVKSIKGVKEAKEEFARAVKRFKK